MSGVPQGSVLGPLLFLVYINDLPDGIQSVCSMFADDTKVYGSVQSVEGVNRLQKDLDRLSDWTDTWKVHFNEDKCKIMHSGVNNPRNQYRIGKSRLGEVDSVKDLGGHCNTGLKVECPHKHNYWESLWHVECT